MSFWLMWAIHRRLQVCLLAYCILHTSFQRLWIIYCIFHSCANIIPVVVLVEGVTAPGADISVKKVSVQHDAALGAYHFDMQLFEHFSAKCGAAKVMVFVEIFAPAYRLVFSTNVFQAHNNIEFPNKFRSIFVD